MPRISEKKKKLYAKQPLMQRPQKTPADPNKWMNGLGIRKVGGRYRPGERALLEIRKYQKGSDLLIPRGPFGRLCQEILQEVSGPDKRFEQAAVEALQYVTETHMVCQMSSKCLIDMTRQDTPIKLIQVDF
jgi:histone H3/H4